jgi:hypothetical protein
MPTQRQIAVEFWTSRAIRPLPSSAKLLCNYAMTGPQATFIGLYRFSWDDAQDDTKLTTEEITEGLRLAALPQAHDGDPFLRYDPDTRVVWVVKRSAREFPTGQLSGKQRQGIRKMIEKLPRCALVREACERYRYLGEPFSEFADKLSQEMGQPDTPLPESGIPHTPQPAYPIPEETPFAETGIPHSPESGYPIPQNPDTPCPKSGNGSGSGGSESGGSGSGGTGSGSRLSALGSQKNPAVADASGDHAKANGTSKALKDNLDATESARFKAIVRDLDAQTTRDADRFDAWQCAQMMFNGGLPIAIVKQLLLRCKAHGEKESIHCRWAWFNRVLKAEHAELHITLQLQEHERIKHAAPNTEVIGEVLRRMTPPAPPASNEPVF